MQIGFALTGNLSPWKGGGFGMFSTIESPSSRIIRIHLVTNGSKIPIEVPKAYSKLAGRIRARPTQKSLDQFAELLSNSSWARYELMPAEERYLILHDKYFPGMPVAADTFSTFSPNTYKGNLNELFSKMQMVYMLNKNESTRHPVEFESVAVVCYQLEYDNDRQKLVLERLMQSQKNRRIDD